MKAGHINDWAPEVRALLKRLIAAGATIVSGDNGEERFKYAAAKEDEFIDNLIACDEAHLYVHTPHCKPGRNRWLYLVLGNSPGEIVSDYIVDDLLDKVTDEHYKEWEGKSQPTKLSPCEREAAPLKLSSNSVVLPIVGGTVPDPEPQ